MEQNETPSEGIVEPEKTNEQTPTVEEQKTETPTEKKPQRTPEEELKYFEGRAKRLRKDLGLEEKKETPQRNITKKSDGLDWGQKAYLKTSGVEESDFEFIEQTLADTGKPLDALLNATWFQGELKDRKDRRKITEAMPSSKPLQGEASQSKVEYWMNQRTLPPDTPENRELREKIVQTRYERAKAAR